MARVAGWHRACCRSHESRFAARDGQPIRPRSNCWPRGRSASITHENRNRLDRARCGRWSASHWLGRDCPCLGAGRRHRRRPRALGDDVPGRARAHSPAVRHDAIGGQGGAFPSPRAPESLPRSRHLAFPAPPHEKRAPRSPRPVSPHLASRHRGNRADQADGSVALPSSRAEQRDGGDGVAILTPFVRLVRRQGRRAFR